VNNPSIFLLVFTLSATVGFGGVGGAFFVVSGFVAWLFAGLFCAKLNKHINIPLASKSKVLFACIIFVLIFLKGER
jgi:hypothetical protein